MEHAQTVQGGRTWYLIASGGDIAMRVRSGMPLGETRSGELSFDPVHAQLELEIEADGGLIVRVIGRELAFVEGSHQHTERVGRDRRAEIHLPHNILRLDTDFIGPPQAENTLQIRTVQAAPELRQQPQMVAERPAGRHRRRSRAPLWPWANKRAVLLALGSVALVVLVVALGTREEPTAAAEQDIVTAVVGQQEQPSSATKPAPEVPRPTASGTDRTEMIRPELAVQDDALSPVQQSAVVAASGDDAIPEVEPEVPALLIAESSTGPSAEFGENDPPVATVPRRTGETRPNQPAELTREHDLLAANLALAENRLMAPPETSAFALFSKVLQANPDSTEAKRGLQAVRERLINRTFAQLASKAWDDARITLVAAADAGVNAAMVADLRGEVDYGQRLADAQAGRFESRYPGEKLVAINRPPPRLRRLRSSEPRSVEAQFTVTEFGRVRDIELLGEPSAKVEREVRRVMDQWRFEPVLYKGRPLPVRTSLWLAVGR